MMLWRSGRDKARREQALELTRALVTTWAPDEQLALDLVSDSFLHARPFLSETPGRQEFGPEFFSELSVALLILASVAAVLKVPLGSRVEVDLRTARGFHAVVRLKLGESPDALGGILRQTPDSPLVQRAVELLAKHVVDPIEQLGMCTDVEVPAAFLSGEHRSPAEFWSPVIKGLVSSGDRARLQGLLQIAADLHPQEPTFAELGRVLGYLC